MRYSNGQSGSAKLVYRSRPDEPCPFGWNEVLAFARNAKEEFFERADIKDDAINRPDVTFETGVAEKFLLYSKTERDKIRKLGPITARTWCALRRPRRRGIRS